MKIQNIPIPYRFPSRSGCPIRISQILAAHHPSSGQRPRPPAGAMPPGPVEPQTPGLFRSMG